MPAPPVGVDSREPRNSSSLTGLAYETLKEEILSTRLRPGEAVPTERLTATLGVGRTPIREAVLRLEKEGLVEIRPRMGTFVSALNLREIREMYEVRRTLEGLAARRASRHASADRLADAERGLGPYRGADPATLRAEDYAGMQEAGQALHRLIVDTCQNEVLARLIRSLQDHFRRFRSLSRTLPQKLLTSHAQHLEILEALKARDEDRAERLVHEHFDAAARSLLDSLMGEEGRQPGIAVAVGPRAPSRD
jgi:DNA-binding GntR family transcriptional regulator